ncbi:MAG TPA: alkaline phosphatase family protein [Thermoanaerobaculia bacterium]|nr:alkaline phosphatase family protein [Thermoanaerobaculia bacterium]
MQETSVFTGRKAAVVAALLPGALLGAHLGLLLFFLNPTLELTSTVVLRGVATLALAGGIIGGAALALLARGRPERLVAMLPWGITAALALAAAAQWTQAAHFAYYLPPGINSRLLKAASGVSLVTLLCFYTALLHGMQRRRYGWRSRGGLALLALLSLLLTAERRSAFPSPPPAPAEVGLRPRPAQTNLLVVALEGATLDAILPLAEQGQLPFLATLLRQGASGRVTTLSPPLRVAVWNSVATGAYPFRHGVVSDHTLDAPFLHPAAGLTLAPWGTGFARWSRPLGVRVRDQPPRSSAPPLWRIFEGPGISTAVVGWPAAAASADDTPRTTVPESLFVEPDLPLSPTFAAAARIALELRPSLQSVDPAILGALGGDLPSSVQEAVVADLWRASVARAFLDGEAAGGPTAIFVGLPGLLEVSRIAFGGFSAVQFDGSSRSDHRSSAQLVGGYYGLVDRLLARMWANLPEPRLLALVAGHGVREPRRWRRILSGLSPEISIEGRIDGEADGMLMLLGGNLRSGVVLPRTAIVDVAPTILYAMGQPVPRDGDGKVQTAAFGSAFLTRNPLTFVPSYAALAASSRGTVSSP